MPSFAGVDFIDFDSQLNDEEKLVRQTARQFVDNEVLPVIEKHNREATFPMHLVAQLGELGFFGANLHGYGCAGMSNTAYGLVMQELERGDSGLRSFVSVQSSLVMYPIHGYGSHAQKEKWLPAARSGKAIGCSRPHRAAIRFQSRRNADACCDNAASGYVLNGEKMWITNGSLANVALIWAKCEDEQIRGFLVDKGTPRFQNLGCPWQMVSARVGDFRPGAHRLRNPRGKCAPGRGRSARPAQLPDTGPVRHRLGCDRAAMACYDTALQYAKTRKQFANKPIASHQLVQEKLAWMITEIVKAQLLALHVGRLKDQGKVDHATSPC